MLFKDLNLITPIQEALKTEGYNRPTPIQEKAIPSILAGRDLLGCARTGTGKTAAFAIPILQILSRGKRAARDNREIGALILAPTRELALQIGESFEAYGRNLNLRTMVVYGGVSQDYQIDALSGGIDILVATPGRLLDLINQGNLSIGNVEMLVIDEADRMLDMGMGQEVKKIIAKLPVKRQNLLFSATMPQEVSQLVNSILASPVKIEVKSGSSPGKSIRQSVYFVDERDKISLLIHLLKSKSMVSVLVFTRTKQRAERVKKALEQEGIRVEAIHGDKTQHARQEVLNSFKNRQLRVLVATDVAARGIDVDELTHVINFDLPNVPETYVHRIGRTGRAGRGGAALSFCNHQEKGYLKDIEKLMAQSIPIIKDHPYSLKELVVEWSKDSAKKSRKPSTGKPVPRGDSKKGERGRKSGNPSGRSRH